MTMTMANKQVGYLTNYSTGLEGERGIFFNYILAGNGLFIEASNKSLSARIPVSDCPVRGLAPLQPRITLTYGSIPQRFFDLALDTFLAAPDKENYVGVTADAGYNFYVPGQQQEKAKVVYDVGSSVILDIHSHGTMHAFFSGQDDKDETGFQLYAVVGDLRKVPVVLIRVGVYGYFYYLKWKEVFDGTLYVAREPEYEEVLDDDVHDTVGGQLEPADSPIENHSSGMWWNRWFRS